MRYQIKSIVIILLLLITIIPIHTASTKEKDELLEIVSRYYGINPLYTPLLEDGIKDIEEAIQKYPKSPYLANGYYQVGYLRFKIGKYSEALDDFKKTKVIPNIPEKLLIATQNMLAQSLRYMGRKDEAISAFGELVRLIIDIDMLESPQSRSFKKEMALAAHVYRAELYIERALYDQAIREYEQFISLRPSGNQYTGKEGLEDIGGTGLGEAGALERIAELYLKKGKTKEAIDTYSRLLIEYPSYEKIAIVTYEKAKLIYELDKDDANFLTALEDILKNNPDSSYLGIIRYDLGIKYHEKNEPEKSVEQFRSIISDTKTEKLYPTIFQEAMLRLGIILGEEKNYDEAFKHLETLITKYAFKVAKEEYESLKKSREDFYNVLESVPVCYTQIATDTVATKDISIDYSYMRKMTKGDEGTLHIFVKNNGKEKVSIDKVRVNNILLYNKDLPKESFICEKTIDVLPKPTKEPFVWHQIIPNPIGPKQVADIMVRLNKTLTPPIKVDIETSIGEKLSSSINQIGAPIRITYIGFNDELDKIYIYIKNAQTESVTIKNVYLGTEEITTNILDKEIPSQEKQCIIANLKTPLRQGQYITVKIIASNNTIAETLTRVFSLFPINLEGGDIAPGLQLNQEKTFLPYPPENITPEHKAYHILDCPIHCHGDISQGAREIISRANTIRRIDPFNPVHIGICRVEKEIGYFLYGETADIVLMNPNLTSFNYSQLKEENEHCTQWLTHLAKMGCEPRPLQTLITTSNDSPYFVNRYPTSEEIRLMAYYTISRGSKGIFYRGQSQDTDVKEEIRNINKELQILKRYLKIGEPVSLAESNNSKVEANTILAGDKGIVLILINHDTTGFDKSFTYTPKTDFTVTVHTPDWLDIKEVYEVDNSLKKVEYKIQGKEITIPIENLGLTKQIVLSTTPDDYNYSQKLWIEKDDH